MIYAVLLLFIAYISRVSLRKYQNAARRGRLDCNDKVPLFWIFADNGSRVDIDNIEVDGGH